MKIINYKTIIVLFIIVFLESLSGGHLFAQRTDRFMKDVETKEAAPAPVEEIIARPKMEYQATNLRDPFQPYLEEKEEGPILVQQAGPDVPLPPLAIQGIVWGGPMAHAIINNKVVKVGDTIEGARILGIGKEGITVFFNSRQYKVSSPAGVYLQSLEKKPEGGKDEK